MNETEYLLEEIKTHNTKESVWIIVDDYVFDVTTYMSKHPVVVKYF